MSTEFSFEGDSSGIKVFCQALPKAELHAHLNGSIGIETIHKLIELKKKRCSNFHLTDSEEVCIKEGYSRSLKQVFEMFKLIHSITDTEEAVALATKDVIEDFAADNVRYLELRSTPKLNPETGLTKERYVEAVLNAMKDRDETGMVVRLLLSIDRRQNSEQAEETVQLALKYHNLEGRVVGVELSGDPSQDGRKFLTCLRRAKREGLKVSVHLAEVVEKVQDETMDLLQIPPDRIGHATFMCPEVGGSEAFVEQVLRNKIPIEMCLSSNVKCKTVTSYDNHHMGSWLEKNHPVAICTDDKGVFDTTLTQEYVLAADAFQLTRRNLYDLSLQALDSAFITDSQRHSLRCYWEEFRSHMSL